MTISNIVVNAEIFRDIDKQDFGADKFPTDADIQAISYELSRQEMEFDLYQILSFNGSDRTTKLNELIADYLTEFQTLLMFCQLKNFYFANVQGLDERDYVRYKDFEKRYKLQLSYILKLKSRVYNTISSGRISRA